MNPIKAKLLAVAVAGALCLVGGGAFFGFQHMQAQAATVGTLAAVSESAKARQLPSIDTMMPEIPEVVDPFYVLIIGNDSRDGTVEANTSAHSTGPSRSDTMMLTYIDPQAYRVTLVSIPRDTSATVNGQPGTKINEAYYHHGAQGAMDAAGELAGVSITYYLEMDFVRFDRFVDAMGGITVHVPIDMSLRDIVRGGTVSLSAGTQQLNGAEALVLARTRKPYGADQDAIRQTQDRQIVEAFIFKVAKELGLVSQGVDTLLAHVGTNWPEEELRALVEDFAEHADQIIIHSGTGPYDGRIFDEYGGSWLAYREEDTWREIIRVVEQGGDPQAVVPLPWS
ncbi:MAG: LCP family protein [Eggerthellaceae bacterium]|nr:LCP family protein [Eggerthellaceae bacterium]MDR2716426.1 LCP family protein [Coriobacteriaceae bacterium]